MKHICVAPLFLFNKWLASHNLNSQFRNGRYSNRFLPYLFSKANTSWRLHYLKSVFHCNAWQHSECVHYSCVNNQCRSPRDLVSPSPVLGVPDLTHLCSAYTFLRKLFLTPAPSPTMETGSRFICGPTASRPAFYKDWLHQQHLGAC